MIFHLGESKHRISDTSEPIYTCPRCNNLSVRSAVFNKKNTILFVPSIPSVNKNVFHCSICDWVGGAEHSSRTFAEQKRDPGDKQPPAYVGTDNNDCDYAGPSNNIPSNMAPGNMVPSNVVPIHVGPRYNRWDSPFF